MILTTDRPEGLLREPSARKYCETLLRLAVTRIIFAITRMSTSCVFEKNGQIFTKAFLNQKNKILLNFQTIDTFAYPYDLNITFACNVKVRYGRLIMRILSDL